MKKLLTTLSLMALFLCPQVTYAAKGDPQCAIFSKSKFLDTMTSNSGIHVLMMKPEDTLLLLKVLNLARAKDNLEPINATTILVGVFKDNKDFIGLAFFDSDGCVLPSGVIKVTTQSLVELLKEAGASNDPFVELTPA